MILTKNPLFFKEFLNKKTPFSFWLKGYELFSFTDVDIDLSSRSVARQVLWALQSLTSVFGMGTGGPSAFETPTGEQKQFCVSIDLSSRSVARQVFSTLQSLTSVFGMGTGGPSAFETLTIGHRLL